MIIVTGAAGFIGSCLVGRLNQAGFSDVVVVDDWFESRRPSAPGADSLWWDRCSSQDYTGAVLVYLL